ncbi:MAG TPA: hypothetical protein VFU04_02035, partial [Solirubrobacterales bacterium]|nr:hypothetical protein [Solirubrobacterales bacterium]
DGVTRVVSRRLPREVEEGEEGTPPPFAGVDAEQSEQPAAEVPGLLGAKPPAEPRRGDDSAAAA